MVRIGKQTLLHDGFCAAVESRIGSWLRLQRTVRDARTEGALFEELLEVRTSLGLRRSWGRLIRLQHDDQE